MFPAEKTKQPYCRFTSKQLKSVSVELRKNTRLLHNTCFIL